MTLEAVIIVSLSSALGGVTIAFYLQLSSYMRVSKSLDECLAELNKAIAVIDNLQAQLKNRQTQYVGQIGGRN